MQKKFEKKTIRIKFICQKNAQVSHLQMQIEQVIKVVKIKIILVYNKQHMGQLFGSKVQMHLRKRKVAAP